VILALVSGLALIGAAVALTLRAVAIPRMAAATRVGEIKAYGFGGEPDADADERGSAIDRAASAVGQAVARHSRRFKEEDVRHHLVTAGMYTTSPNTFLGYRVLSSIALPTAMVWMLGAIGSQGGLVIVGGILGAFTGWSLPMSVVRRRAQQRMERVEVDLPELIDLLVVTVEAGLGFSGSLRVAADRFHGPLRDELRLTLQEQRLGLPTNTALTHLLERCETPSMRSFVRSVLQGETLGVSIGHIMRNLGVEMRKRRRQYAEERAQKAPVKMLFPAAVLIFPALLIMILYPAVVGIVDTFRN
jgi:tight adherence protein C